MSTTDSSPITIEDVEVRRRAELVAGLRGAADFIEATPVIPACFSGLRLCGHVTSQTAFADALAALGDPPLVEVAGDVTAGTYYVIAERWFGPVLVGVQALASTVFAACPECHGNGEVTVNPTSDPQEAYESPCPACHGDGVRP